MKVYVKAKSKKDINERIANGERIYGYNYSMFGDGGMYELTQLNDGDVVGVYQKMIDGNPYARSWGAWDSNKQKLK